MDVKITNITKNIRIGVDNITLLPGKSGNFDASVAEQSGVKAAITAGKLKVEGLNVAAKQEAVKNSTVNKAEVKGDSGKPPEHQKQTAGQQAANSEGVQATSQPNPAAGTTGQAAQKTEAKDQKSSQESTKKA